MNKIMIEALKRTAKPKQVRREGFIPGVLSGPGAVSMPVQFKANELNKIFDKYGTTVKLWIKADLNEKFGFIKEVQRDPVGGKIIHISIQLVSVDQNVRLHLPIVFEGQDALKSKFLQLHVEKPEIEVEGKAEFMPSDITIDVSQKAFGNNITSADFALPPQVKLLDSNDEIFATVKGKNKGPAEKVEETPELKTGEVTTSTSGAV